MTHYGILFHTFLNVCYHPPDQWPFVWEQMTPSQCSTVQTYYCLLFSEDWRSHCVLQSLHIFFKFNQICGCRSIHIRCYCWESWMSDELRTAVTKQVVWMVKNCLKTPFVKKGILLYACHITILEEIKINLIFNERIMKVLFYLLPSCHF